MSHFAKVFGNLSLTAIGRMSEDEARAVIERIRWPDGKPVCPHCGTVDAATLMTSADDTENKVRSGLYNCRSCREPFTCTVATAMESSHISLVKWLMGFFLMSSSKKGVSAKQLQRQLPLGSYKSAWFLCHRIRAAMGNGGPQAPLTGDLEADEVYMGGKKRRVPGGPKKQFKRGRGTDRPPVAVLVARSGEARARLLPRVNKDNLASFLLSNTDPANATLHTDELPDYKVVGRKFVAHHTTSHRAGQYVKPGGITSNTAEAFISLIRRGVYGQFHHVSVEHLPRYLDEFSYRWTHRGATDTERTVTAIARSGGARLFYRKPKSEEAGGNGLVANG